MSNVRDPAHGDPRGALWTMRNEAVALLQMVDSLRPYAIHLAKAQHLVPQAIDTACLAPEAARLTHE
ncbi:MAG: hypothetical protein ACRD3Q_01800 [Terriglobales bacterium]